MDSLGTVQLQLIRVFAVIVVAALLLALFLSQVLTKPITDLSRTMRKMGKGDLSVRAPVRGSGELKELAENYNTMAEQLERMDQSRNQFVSNASHELRTPLTTMKIMLETVMYEPDMPQELRTEFMQDMNHEIDRLSGIVNDLLTLTRIDNESMEMKTETVDVTALTWDTIRMLKPMAEKRKQHLIGNVQPDLTMQGDKLKLNQILYNLTDNAIKYTPEGGNIGIMLTEEEGNIVWRVRDDGIGIPPEDQRHIFERFYRVDKARSRETGGTGLGLSIVKQLVTAHGGTISVYSETGKGTEFTVVLPREGEPQ
jgi:signal transduction histidine kinase